MVSKFKEKVFVCYEDRKSVLLRIYTYLRQKNYALNAYLKKTKRARIPDFLYIYLSYMTVMKVYLIILQACGREWKSDKIWDHFIKFEVSRLSCQRFVFFFIPNFGSAVVQRLQIKYFDLLFSSSVSHEEFIHASSSRSICLGYQRKELSLKCSLPFGNVFI